MSHADRESYSDKFRCPHCHSSVSYVNQHRIESEGRWSCEPYETMKEDDRQIWRASDSSFPTLPAWFYAKWGYEAEIFSVAWNDAMPSVEWTHWMPKVNEVKPEPPSSAQERNPQQWRGKSLPVEFPAWFWARTDATNWGIVQSSDGTFPSVWKFWMPIDGWTTPPQPPQLSDVLAEFQSIPLEPSSHELRRERDLEWIKAIAMAVVGLDLDLKNKVLSMPLVPDEELFRKFFEDLTK